ncbi:hypothetical protein [Chitinophaga vietnamensis]|nr:hypothetical protein [Chitinophaga vietnamensis]
MKKQNSKKLTLGTIKVANLSQEVPANAKLTIYTCTDLCTARRTCSDFC